MSQVSQSKIVLAKSDYVDLYKNLKKALDALGDLKLTDDATVVIKINLCDARTPDTGAITHPAFLDALLRILREIYGYKLRLKVVESDATVALPDLFIKWFGFLKVLEKWKAEYVNLSREETVYKKSGGKILKSIPVPKTMEEADYFITVPKLKTNSLTKITCCLKNQFGCLPFVNKRRFHWVIDEVIAEVNKVMKPNLCIVDGIISHVGVQGPAFGQPLYSKLVIVGFDPVAVDTFASKLLGFNPRFVGHIIKSKKVGVGSMNYELINLADDSLTKPIYKPNRFEWLLYRFGSFLQEKAKKVKVEK